MAITIDLLRHGATTVDGCYIGRSDPELSESGWAAMWAAVEGQQWDRVMTSPRRRCAHFAQAYASRHQLEWGEDPRLVELDFGDWDGQRVADIHAREPQALGRFWADPERFPPPRGESIDSLRRRVAAAIADLQASCRDGERLLVVTHGGPMRALIAQRDGLPAGQWLQVEVAHAALLRWAG